MVLVPRARGIGGRLAALNWTVSAVVNLTVDGFDYFVRVLPLNIVATVLGIVLFLHHRRSDGGPGIEIAGWSHPATAVGSAGRSRTVGSDGGASNAGRAA